MALQEVQRRQVARLAAALSMPSKRWAFKHWPFSKRPEGLAVLSPHRLVRAERFRLRRAWFWSWKRRVGIDATVDAGGRLVRVLDVHLTSHDDAEQRVREAATLVARAVRGRRHRSSSATSTTGRISAHRRSSPAPGGSTPGQQSTTLTTSGRRTGRPANAPVARRRSASTTCSLLRARSCAPAAVAVDPADLDRAAGLSDHLPVAATVALAVSEAMHGKVRKLLAKAEATDNPNEAAAFSAKAAQLIAAHRIDPSRLAAEHADGDRLGLRRVPIGRGAYVRARLALLGAVAAANDCELVWQSGPDGATALLAGFESDLDATLVLHESLHLQAAGQMAALRRSTPAATQRWRRAFLFGFAARVGELLADARQRAEADARSTGTCAAGRPIALGARA